MGGIMSQTNKKGIIVHAKKYTMDKKKK